MSDDWQVYVLKSLRNGRLYTGSTNDLARRVHEHASGQSRYAQNAGPFELVHQERLADRLSARRANSS
ncbi:MAG: GIY-YIG nuclease family protein [Dehalococcoidia bacterium]|nr:MAG: GIY-YIG nuclease family protein [Dehalococcoidia bacterium]